jgi:hypothetical protein
MYTQVEGNGNLIRSKVMLKQGAGWVYTPPKKCTGLYPHAINPKTCGYCGKRPPLTGFAATVVALLDSLKAWIEFRFGDK